MEIGQEVERDKEGAVKTGSGSNTLMVLSILLLVLFSPLAIDVYLPAFPEMAEAFSVDKVIIQDTMTWFMFSLGVGQIIAGPLADRYGRRPIALFGIVLYVLCSFGIAQTHNLDTLLVLRLLQGLGACACSVAGFATVRVYFGAHKSAQIISYINALICFGTASAPILGSWITQTYGWQANFSFMFLFGISAGLIIYFGFSQSKSPAQLTDATSQTDKPLFHLSQYFDIIKNPVFSYHVILCMLSMSVLLAYVSSAPTWLMMELGLSKNQFTTWFAANAVINIIACFYTPKLIKKVGSRQTLTLGVYGLMLSASLMLLLSTFHDTWAFMLPSFIASIGYGFILSTAAARALAPFTHNAGTAAALLGLFQMSGSGLIVILLLRLGLDTPILVALIMFLTLPFVFILNSKFSKHWYKPA